jgi:hypothetical protein
MGFGRQVFKDSTLMKFGLLAQGGSLYLINYKRKFARFPFPVYFTFPPMNLPRQINGVFPLSRSPKSGMSGASLCTARQILTALPMHSAHHKSLSSFPLRYLPPLSVHLSGSRSKYSSVRSLKSSANSGYS